MSGVAIGELHFTGELLVGSGRKNFLLKEREVPFGEIGGGHGKLAGGEIPAGSFAPGGTRRTQGIARIGRRVGGLRGGPVRGGLHSERLEDIFSKKIHEALAGDFFKNRAGENVVRIAVLPFCSGVEIERLFGPAIEDGERGGGLGPFG